jgi:hypothetical protein
MKGTQPDPESERPINAAPTKAFFVEFLIRDIPLEQAALDLVDNCIDGARTLGANGSFEGRWIKIHFDKDRFSIIDNCGGFDRATARDYAFRFGRPAGAPTINHSIGQFGVGMKRALFKFGRHFAVRSATKAERWAIDVNVDTWEEDADNWHFPWAVYPDGADRPSEANPGTEIVVDNLRPEVSAKFSTTMFRNQVSSLIRSKHREFIAKKLSVSINGTHLTATSLLLLISGELQPGVSVMTFDEEEEVPVSVRITVGLGDSVPTAAGWYVICNGRVILEADRRTTTGWGLVEENANRVVIPTFHNQFARFRGLVIFDSESSGRLPWNTTKTDVDQDSPIWQKTFQRMREMMRAVINFLNDLDEDVDEYTPERSGLLARVNTATRTRADELRTPMTFKAPARGSIAPAGPRSVTIQYSRPVVDVEFLQEALGVDSARAVGGKTFDLVLERQRME